MHETSFAKMRAFVETYLSSADTTPLEIVDVGARSVDGHAAYRPLFTRQSWHYRGLDMSAGTNVDIVAGDPDRWPELPDASVDVIVSGQALEHVGHPWLTMAEIARVLKPGGAACLILSSAGPEHRYTHDCWRIYSDGIAALARSAGLGVVEVFTDWGILPWQDTFAVLQKPHETHGGRSALPLLATLHAAFSVYRKAITGRPRVPLYYTTLASLLVVAGETDLAEAALRIGIEACPSAHELRQQLIARLLASARTEAAVEHAIILLGMRPISPANVEAVDDVVAVMEAQRRAWVAMLLPAEPQALTRIATLATARGRYELAALCWMNRVQSEPDNWSHVANYAGALLGADRREEARDLFARARRMQLDRGEINRTTLIQRLINGRGAELYLEIGVAAGFNFFQVEAPLKFAVDPRHKIPGGLRGHDNERFFSMTSDAFFADPPAELLEHGIDVAFVDGLHTYAQSLQDIEHCLRHLNQGGVIIVHDCLPASGAEAMPSLEEARRLPQFKGDWTGDVYRSIMHLRSRRPDLFVAVLDADHGVGIVQPGTPESTLDLTDEQIASLDYATLSVARERLLNLKPARWIDCLLPGSPAPIIQV